MCKHKSVTKIIENSCFRHFEADDMQDFVRHMEKFAKWYWNERDGEDRTAQWFEHCIKDEYKEFVTGYETRGQQSKTNVIGDHVNVHSLWSGQPDLKNKFL